jgi:hypothetical protein
MARPQCGWHTPLIHFDTHSQLFVNSIILKWPPRGQKGTKFDYFLFGNPNVKCVVRKLAHSTHTSQKFSCEKKEKNHHHDDIKKNSKVVCAHDPLFPHPPPHLLQSGVTKFEYILSTFWAHSVYKMAFRVMGLKGEWVPGR